MKTHGGEMTINSWFLGKINAVVDIVNRGCWRDCRPVLVLNLVSSIW